MYSFARSHKPPGQNIWRFALLLLMCLLMSCEGANYDGYPQPEGIGDSGIKAADATTLPTIQQPDSEFHMGSGECSCGKPVGKIVGGEVAKINDLPWTALLYKRNFFNIRKAYCGATLINNLYLVTASHCVDGVRSNRLEVDLKEEDRGSTTDSKTETFKISKIIAHPNYDRRTVDNDIALLKLDRPVELVANGEFVPACVPIDSQDTFVGKNATAAGWGATRPLGGVSKVLRRVNVPIVSNEECNNTRYKGKITENMLCAGYIKEGGKDACQGDSGGPLVVESKSGRQLLVGVVSWGYGCARPNSPGVYTRITRYIDWIVANTKDATWCSE